MRIFTVAIFLFRAVDALAETPSLDDIVNGSIAVKMLAGFILFFLVVTMFLFKRLPFKWRDLWKNRKKLDVYQNHIDKIDDVLARALALGKMKKSGDGGDWVHKKAEIDAEIKELLKQSPLNNDPKEEKDQSKLDPRAKTSISKLSPDFKYKK
ncbi:MAG: hypothetical protein HYV97_10130 [Bdellovibrio sp.]|nr:hypothetical protein [Bdellovibrio sp.]